jgi:hypothetical protein
MGYQVPRFNVKSMDPFRVNAEFQGIPDFHHLMAFYPRADQLIAHPEVNLSCGTQGFDHLYRTG